MMTLRNILCVAALAACTTLNAADSLRVKFRSRALLDATASGYGKESVQGYSRLEDFRVGFKATYGNYELKADVGLGGGKVAIKDLLLNYHFKNSVLAFGNAYEPFSMDMLISTVDMRFNQSAASVLAFTNSRKLGLTYHYYTDNCYLATGIYSNNDINKLGTDKKNSIVSTTRAVWRRQDRERQRLIHVGGAFSYRTREVNKDTYTGSVSSAGVTSMFPVSQLGAEITDMGSEIKCLVEALYTSRKVLIQTEYFVDRMNRRDGKPAYTAHGGYVQGSCLIAGEGFEYDAMYGIPGRPSSEMSLELVARFNYTDMNDAGSNIFGGEEKDLSLGLNWYLNRYIGIKLNGSYVWTGSHCNSFYSKDFFLAQARIQYVF